MLAVKKIVVPLSMPKSTLSCIARPFNPVKSIGEKCANWTAGTEKLPEACEADYHVTA